jgi:DNA-binding response OmpR family regulator
VQINPVKFKVPDNVSIVILEVSKELALVYEKFFRSAGLNVIATFNRAEDLFSGFTSSYNSEIRKSIVLLDYKMPEMDGVTIARRLKELNSSQRIILTTLEDPSKFSAMRYKLFDAIITRPFTISDLLAAIDEKSIELIS